MAPASSNTEIAQPCSVRIAGRRFFIIRIEKPSCAKKDTASPASPIRNVEPRICTASSGYQNGVHLVPNALYRLDNTVEPTVRAEHCRQETLGRGGQGRVHGLSHAGSGVCLAKTDESRWPERQGQYLQMSSYKEYRDMFATAAWRSCGDKKRPWARR